MNVTATVAVLAVAEDDQRLARTAVEALERLGDDVVERGPAPGGELVERLQRAAYAHLGPGDCEDAVVEGHDRHLWPSPIAFRNPRAARLHIGSTFVMLALTSSASSSCHRSAGDEIGNRPLLLVVEQPERLAGETFDKAIARLDHRVGLDDIDELGLRKLHGFGAQIRDHACRRF